MPRILIGDIGSTKGTWVLYSNGRSTEFTTPGYNPVMHPVSQLRTLMQALSGIADESIDTLSYYGSGIIGDAEKTLIATEFATQFTCGEVRVESDLLGACRALSDGTESIVCILGTGSNSCVFNGKTIERQIPSLGFPLGDEGSGADIGRACVRAYYYGLMPVEIKTAFSEKLPSDRREFLREYQSQPAQNRYLAALAEILGRFSQDPFTDNLLLECFCTFTRLHIAPYRAVYPIHATGSIAYHFQNQWRNALHKEGLIAGKTVKNPVQGLLEYHLKHIL